MFDSDARSSEYPLSNAEVYRYGPLYRWGAYGIGILVVLVAIAVCGTAIIKGLSEVDAGTVGVVAMGLVSAATSVSRLLSELHLTEDQLRKTRSLRANREVRLNDVRRVFIGGVTVELYVSSDADPALTFDRKVQGGDDLIEKLVGRLPAGAEVDHPSGELERRLGIA